MRKKMMFFTALLVLVVMAGSSYAAPVYLLDFDHGVKDPNPGEIYVPSGTEVLPGGVTMVEENNAKLVDMPIAPQGGQALEMLLGAAWPNIQGYTLTGGPNVPGPYTVEVLINANFKPCAFDLTNISTIFKSRDHMPGPKAQGMYIDQWTGQLIWHPGQTGLGLRQLEAATEIKPGRWYHIAVVCDANADTLKLYVNGVVEDECIFVDTWEDLVGFDPNVFIGHAGPMQSRNWQGQIDAFCIDDTTLAPENFNLPIPATAVYLLDFDHGEQAPAPSPYVASSNEIMPADSNMVLQEIDPLLPDVFYTDLVDSGYYALQGGQSLTQTAAAGAGHHLGYEITNGPNIPGPYTVEVLINPDYTNTPLSTVGSTVYKSKDHLPGQRGQGMLVDQWTGILKFHPGMTMTTWWGKETLDSTTSLQAGTWYHIAVVCDANADTITLYVDGVAEDSGIFPDTWEPLVGFDSTLYIGAPATLNQRNWQGQLDAFIIRDFAADPCEFYLLTDLACLGLMPGDIYEDCAVDFQDLAEISAEWLDCTLPGVCVPLGPNTIPLGTANVDGDLDEWADADWIALDQPYWATTPDVAEAKFAVRWDPNTDRIYAAVVVNDANRIFTDGYVDWDDADIIEVYSHGDETGGDHYGISSFGWFDTAQQYIVGANTNQIDYWAVLGSGDPNVGPGYTDLLYSVAVDDTNDLIVYELGVKQFDNYGGISGGSTVISDLTSGDIVGFDIVVGTRYGTNPGDFGMLAANMMLNKYVYTSAFQKYTLIGTDCDALGYPGADISGPAGVPDCVVNLYDFAALASDWMIDLLE